MGMTEEKTRQANNRLPKVLAVAAVLMFGFGYALVPLYDLLCDVTGLNGKTGKTDIVTAESEQKDITRLITVEFTSHTNTGLPWEFRALQKKMRVTPGKLMVAKYYARNTSNEIITGQAVPSVAPNRAASHFKKVECFCFSNQTLKPGEAKEMLIRFIVDSRLAKEVDTITLSYTFFNTDKVSAGKYGGKEMATSHNHHVDVRKVVPDAQSVNKM